ncbi:MAG: hypothetical protein AAF637_21880, partial [Pseudomonadota bacterium]
MSKQVRESPPQSSSTDGPITGEQLAALADKARRVFEGLGQRDPSDSFSIVDPAAVVRAFSALAGKLAAEPDKLAEAQ